MSTPYTPVPTMLPATLDLPEDGVEAVVVETVNTNTAAIADAVAAALGAKNIARLQLTAGVTTSGSTFACSLDSSYYRDTSWTFASNELTVPEEGLYMVYVQTSLSAAFPDEGNFTQIDVHVGGVLYDSAQGHIASGGASSLVAGFVGPIPIIGDVTTQKISIVNPTGNSKTIVADQKAYVFVYKTSSI